MSHSHNYSEPPDDAPGSPLRPLVLSSGSKPSRYSYRADSTDSPSDPLQRRRHSSSSSGDDDDEHRRTPSLSVHFDDGPFNDPYDETLVDASHDQSTIRGVPRHARRQPSSSSTVVSRHELYMTADTEAYDEKASPQAQFATDRRGGGGEMAHVGAHSRNASTVNTSDDETDDFNWDSSSDSDPDAVIDQNGVRRIRAKRGRKVYLKLMDLPRPIRIFIMGIVGTAICLAPFIVMLMAFKTSPVRPQVQVWSIWLAIIWASSCGTFLVVNWVPHVMQRIIHAIYGKVPAAATTYVSTVKATLPWLKLVLCIAWAWISLGGVLAIEFSGGRARPSYFRYIFLTIQALFGTSVIVLVEKLVLRLIAINFHKTAMQDRLETNQKALKALDKLHESAYIKGATLPGNRRMTPAWGRGFGFGSRPVSPGPNTPGGHGAKPSRDGLGGYMAADGSGSGNATADEHAKKERHHHHRKEHSGGKGSGSKTPTMDAATASASGGARSRRPNFANQLTDALTMATNKSSKLYKGRVIGSQQSARKLARKLFYNLGHHRDTLVAEDFVPYFKTEAEAREAFGFFDADNNGDISKTEMRDAVQRIYRERRALSTSMRDMGSAVSKLDGVLMGLALIVIIFIWLLIFNRDSTVANIVPLSTFVVGFSFVFGNSAKTIFESMIFIFATHPYDVGDLVCVDDNWMFVESFGMLTTCFRTVTNQYIVAPNSMLASQKYVFNARRSGATWEVTKIQIGYDTMLQVIDDLRARLRAYVKANDREWGGGLDVNFENLTEMNAVELVIAMEHKGNWQDWGARWARRTKLLREVKTICEDLGIQYQLPPQPVTFHPRSGAAPFQPTSSARGQNFAARTPQMASSSGATGGGGQGGGAFMPTGLAQRPKPKATL